MKVNMSNLCNVHLANVTEKKNGGGNFPQKKLIHMFL